MKIFGLFLISGLYCWAQAPLASGGYRVLGQADLRLNGLNRVEGPELNAPGGVAVDSRTGATSLYISDTRNHRVLAWADTRSFQAGDPPVLVLGQPSAQRSTPLGLGAAGFSNPAGLAVDPMTGHLYVADSGNHRVVRYPIPFVNRARVEPDAVYGQPDFESRTSNTGGVGPASMNTPLAIAFDAGGNLWVADAGNHRVLRFSASMLESPTPEADLAIGQESLYAGAANHSGTLITGAGLDRPAGLAFDSSGNLYVSDFGNSRVLKFSPPFSSGSTASDVFGQPDFATRELTESPHQSTLGGPVGLAVSGAGNLHVAVPAENRVMVFSLAAGRGAPAVNVLGQATFVSTAANSGTAPRSSASTLSAPADVKVDQQGDVYVADTGNHRVLKFPANSRSATQLWGQLDFGLNGTNQVKAGGMNSPRKVAVDYSRQPYALYVADTGNHRILGWRDAVRFRSGDPADLVIGQPDSRTAIANVDAAGGRRPSDMSLSSPRGIALDGQGNLYVADSGNNRVLRFPQPIDQVGRIRADLVIGQSDFSSALSAAVSASSMRQPGAVAVGPDGTLFVADTGNNRVLEYRAGAPSGAQAVRVYGQPDFNSGTAHGAVSPQTLSAPAGLAVDASFNLYVADTGANRVMVFPNVRDAPLAGAVALLVIGNDRFDAVAPTAVPGPRRLNGPTDIALGNGGSIVVADAGNNRVLMFPSLLYAPIADAAAIAVVGQRDYQSVTRNWNSREGTASAEGLSGPVAVCLDRRDTLYVSDTANHRVIHFLRAASVSNAANPQASAMPRGGLVAIEGEGLSTEEATAEAPLPSNLMNREVVINDEVRAPLIGVAPGRITLQMPSQAPLGTQRLAVRATETGELIAGGPVAVATYSPGLYARVTNQDGTVNSTTNAALKGALIRLMGTGQGPVTPPVPDAEAAPDAPINTVAVPTADGGTCLTSQPSVCVAMGNTFGEIQYSGLAPKMVGTWQIDVRIPVGAPNGAVPVRVLINGQPSNVVAVAVR